MVSKRFECDVDEGDFMVISSELADIYFSVYNELEEDETLCNTISLNRDSVKSLITFLEKLV